ncbi:111_t:CDS:2, partial [Racocetra fulgida]
MPAIISLIDILKNYSDYLITTTADMNIIHYSDESAHSPENNSTIYQIAACKHDKLKDNYIELDDYLFEKIHEELPRYFTRQIQKNMLDKKVTPAILQMLHFDLTGNAAVTPSAISRDVEERLRLILTLAYPNIIFDLRTNNGFKGTKFNIFWDETNAYFNEQ